MKKLKLILATALVCMALPVSAQFSNNSSSSSVSSTDAPDSYSRFSVGYNANIMNVDTRDSEDGTLKGFAVQLMAGKKISDTMPLYVEYGGRVSMGFYSESEDDDYDYYGGYDDWEVSLTKLSLFVPVNLTYRLNISETATFSPYAGLHLTGNILGSRKEDGNTYNLFDKDDVGKNNQWTRLQYGMQVGANLSFNKFNIGLEYSFDFNEISKKVSTSDFIISLGVNF